MTIKKWLTIAKKLLLIPSILIIFCLMGYLLLVLAYCIPSSLMEKQLQTSALTFQRESAYPMLTNYGNATLDNFTDSLMMLEASYPPDNVWKAAINVPRYSINNLSPYETLLSICTTSTADLHTETYARYWHGYLIFLRPLLLFFDYSAIRHLLMFVQLGLFTFLIKELAHNSAKMIFPTFFIWIFLNPAATMLSLHYNSILTISFLAMIFILYLNRSNKMNTMFRWGIFFLLVGGCTAYFDLLTYPLVSLGVPLTLWHSLFLSDNLKKNLKNIFFLSFFWFVGYGGLWGTKWIFGSIITGTNLIADAMNMIQFRTASEWNSIKFTFFDIIHLQWEAIQNFSWVLVLICSIFLFQIVTAKRLYLNMIIPFIVIALYPFVWYIILKNHSYIHNFFTYRELSISLYAVMSLCRLYPSRRVSSLSGPH